MKILLIGDIVGKQARKAVQDLAPKLRKEFNSGFCIANGENMAGGAGLSETGCLELKNRGVDVITSGDHVWDQKDFVTQITRLPFVLRPANLYQGQPGRGYGIFNIPIGGKICVINLMGRIFMKLEADCPFQAVDRILEEVQSQTKIIFVDMHAEATSESVAMGRHLDGRVTAVFGTHTHVPTADEQLYPGGAAYISDIGMVGGAESILGRAIEPVLCRFSTGLPARFNVVNDNIVVHGAVVEFDPESGRATHIERFARPWQPESAAGQ